MLLFAKLYQGKAFKPIENLPLKIDLPQFGRCRQILENLAFMFIKKYAMAVLVFRLSNRPKVKGVGKATRTLHLSL